MQPRHERGELWQDLDEQQLAAVEYVFKLYGGTSVVRFSNRLGRRLRWDRWDRWERTEKED